MCDAPCGGDILGQIFSGIAGLLPGAQRGLDFTVGPQTSLATLSGADNRLIGVRAQDGERVTVTPRGQSGRNVTVNNNFNFGPGSDSSSLQRNRQQILTDIGLATRRAVERDG